VTDNPTESADTPKCPNVRECQHPLSDHGQLDTPAYYGYGCRVCKGPCARPAVETPTEPMTSLTDEEIARLMRHIGCDDIVCRIKESRDCWSAETVAPLLATVAALQQRIKELEGELKRERAVSGFHGESIVALEQKLTAAESDGAEYKRAYEVMHKQACALQSALTAAEHASKNLRTRFNRCASLLNGSA
jgi:hypothetical protein